MAQPHIQIDHVGPISYLWLNRPERLNALADDTIDQLIAACGRLQRRHETRVVVLGGKGRAFCAGADLQSPPTRKAQPPGSARRRWVAQLGRRMVEAVESLQAVTIARLHGHVVGGGLVLASACDLRVAARSSLLCLPEVDIGVPLTWGAIPRIMREIGMARSKELILLGTRLTATQAERIGLINAVVPDRKLQVTVDDWAERIAAKPEWATQATKMQFQAYAHASLLGDVTATDGDLLMSAIDVALASARDSPKP